MRKIVTTITANKCKKFYATRTRTRDQKKQATCACVRVCENMQNCLRPEPHKICKIITRTITAKTNAKYSTRVRDQKKKPRAHCA